MADRLVDATAAAYEVAEAIDPALRPRRLTEYVGQRQVTENLGIFIEAARP
ncbi:MAG: Holliday junction helicase RuvB P-loop domain, partial [Pseudomonadota bacterium]